MKLLFIIIILSMLTATVPPTQPQNVARGFARQLLREIITLQLTAQTKLNSYLAVNPTIMQQVVDFQSDYYELGMSGTLNKFAELRAFFRKYNEGEINLEQLVEKYPLQNASSIAKLQGFDEYVLYSGNFILAEDGRSLLNAEQLVTKFIKLVVENRQTFPVSVVDHMYYVLAKTQTIVAEAPQSEYEKAGQVSRLQNLLQTEYEYLLTEASKLLKDYLPEIVSALSIEPDMLKVLTNYITVDRKFLQGEDLFSQAMGNYESVSKILYDYLNTVEQNHQQEDTARRVATAKLNTSSLFDELVVAYQLQRSYDEIALEQLQADVVETELADKYAELFTENAQLFAEPARLKLKKYLQQGEQHSETPTGDSLDTEKLDVEQIRILFEGNDDNIRRLIESDSDADAGTWMLVSLSEKVALQAVADGRRNEQAVEVLTSRINIIPLTVTLVRIVANNEITDREIAAVELLLDLDASLEVALLFAVEILSPSYRERATKSLIEVFGADPTRVLARAIRGNYSVEARQALVELGADVQHADMLAPFYRSVP